MNGSRWQGLSRRAALSAALASCAGTVLAGDSVTSQTLFLITRSKNANVVHYSVRLRDNRLDLEDPMLAYWVMHAEDGRRETLSWLEEFAYGFSLTSKVATSGFRIRLKAFSAREITITKTSNDRYRATMTIRGRTATLDKIFVATDESGVKPKVRYVDLFGRVGKESVTEHLTP